MLSAIKQVSSAEVTLGLVGEKLRTAVSIHTCVGCFVKMGTVTDQFFLVRNLLKVTF